jgi:SAM-dependent methyltransferase
MRGHVPFDNDIDNLGRYKYTGSTARPSSIYANRRQSGLIHDFMSGVRNETILDVGCGDGTYTVEFLNLSSVKKITGIDPAGKAIENAKKNFREREKVHFSTDSINDLVLEKRKFDVVVLRGVLHHCEDPVGVLQGASRLTNQIIILEPNGYNPILKLIEKFSFYHRSHGERSFTSKKINRWLKQIGFETDKFALGILVPFFFPTPLIGIMNWLEPIIQRLPIARRLLLGTQVFFATAKNNNRDLFH